MKAQEFNKLLKEHKNNLQEILRLYCTDKIFLTSKQIEKVIRLRGERTYRR